MRGVVRFVPAGALMGVLWVLSSIPGRAAPVLIADKVAHLIAYAVLGAAVRWGFGHAGEPRRAGAVSFVVATGYGAVDEIHQWFVPGRTASVGDWVADTIGAAIGVAAMAAFVRRTGRSQV